MTALTARLVPALLLVLGGCAVFGLSRPVAAAGGGTTRLPQELLDSVTFDYGCPVERIVVLRKAGAKADLDVCGKVRRYRMVAAEPGSSLPSTWIDVTALYPPDALPSAARAR